MEREPAERRGDDDADHYVVELIHDGRRRYVLCQRILTVDGDDDASGLSPEMIEKLLERRPLRAVALPTARRGRWLGRGGGWPQVGRNVNIDVNVSVPLDP